MNTMRLYEFTTLLEYRRDITVRQLGNPLLQRVRDKSIPDLGVYINLYNVDSNNVKDDQFYLNVLFDQIERGDPTYNQENLRGGQYVPWIAREFARGNIERLEDLGTTVREALGLYNVYKRAQSFKDLYPDAVDIMRVNWQVLRKIIPEYRAKFDQEAEQKAKGIYDIVYKNNDVTVVVPKDITASKYWAGYGGHDASWCTRFPNQFENYSDQGDLYILIPTNPDTTNGFEKYQVHFPTGQIKDQWDHDVDLLSLVRKRFPQLDKFFINYDTDADDRLEFVSDQVVYDLFHLMTADLKNYFYNDYIPRLKNSRVYDQWIRGKPGLARPDREPDETEVPNLSSWIDKNLEMGEPISDPDSWRSKENKKVPKYNEFYDQHVELDRSARAVDMLNNFTINEITSPNLEGKISRVQDLPEILELYIGSLLDDGEGGYIESRTLSHLMSRSEKYVILSNDERVPAYLKTAGANLSGGPRIIGQVPSTDKISYTLYKK